MPAPTTNVVDHLTHVAANEVESSLSLCPVVETGRGQGLLDQTELQGPTAWRNLITVHRGDGQSANPRYVDHVGNDVITTWAH